MTRLLCIAGGSGSGKTTLAKGLRSRLGEETVSILHLDDYQRQKDAVPLTASGRRNYDHPTAIDWHRFVADLLTLKGGQPASVRKRHKSRTMEQGVTDGDLYVVEPRPIVIVEGYLALHDERARALYDASVFLKAGTTLRVERRTSVKDEQYVNEVLLPMHGYFVEPSAEHANLVLTIDQCSPAEVLDAVTTVAEALLLDSPTDDAPAQPS